MFLRKSSIGTVAVQLLEQYCEARHGAPRNLAARTEQRRSQTPGPHQFRERRIVDALFATVGRSRQFRDNAIAIGNQYGFATGGESDIFAQLVFEDFKTNRSHAENKVASGSFPNQE
jgi:hypothetical protein